MLRKEKKSININNNKIDINFKFICEKCDKIFNKKHLLKQHLNRVHINCEFKCKKCNKIFDKVLKLKTHYKVIHDILKPIIFQCDKCEQNFETQIQLNNHRLKSHLKIVNDFKISRNTVQNFEDLISKKDKKFECNKCQIIVESKQSLDLHNEEKHPLIKCYYNECNYETNDEKNFKRHELNHLKPKKYKCVWNECDKSFTFSKDLYKHKINEHNSGHSYRCVWPECEQGFKSQFYLDKHMLRHTGFRCKRKDCDQTFTHLGALRFHQSKH